LKKEADLADGGWKIELNAQILVFLDLLSDNLASVGSSASELRSRLASYRTRLQSDHRQSTTASTSAQPSEEPATRPSGSNQTHAAPSVLAEAVRHLLHLDAKAFADRRDTLRATCTLDAALDDLKVCDIGLRVY
jgi:hypothetical protein